MRKVLIAILASLVQSMCLANPWFTDIEKTAQDLRDQATVSGNQAATATLTADFKEVLEFAGITDVALIVTDNPAFIAQTFPGTVVLNSELAKLDKKYRRFIVAHEVGHILKGHWAAQFTAAKQYSVKKWWQSQSRAEHDFSALSHKQEFEADEFAASYLTSKQEDINAAIEVLTAVGFGPDTVTHPASFRRIQRLKK